MNVEKQWKLEAQENKGKFQAAEVAVTNSLIKKTKADEALQALRHDFHKKEVDFQKKEADFHKKQVLWQEEKAELNKQITDLQLRYVQSVGTSMLFGALHQTISNQQQSHTNEARLQQSVVLAKDMQDKSDKSVTVDTVRSVLTLLGGVPAQIAPSNVGLDLFSVMSAKAVQHAGEPQHAMTTVVPGATSAPPMLQTPDLAPSNSTQHWRPYLAVNTSEP